MASINFCKFHGFGNDYIVVEQGELADVFDIGEFAKEICHRKTGVGGDGIAVVEKSKKQAEIEAYERQFIGKRNSQVGGNISRSASEIQSPQNQPPADKQGGETREDKGTDESGVSGTKGEGSSNLTRNDYLCRIINPDGSEAGFSGNGTRCAVAYLYHKNLWSADSLRLETKSGRKIYELLNRAENTFWFRAELGKPHSIKNEELRIKNHADNLPVVSLDVGNPVCVIFVDDFDALDWRGVGSEIENLTEVFPDRTNVVFVTILDKENVEIRIWERGAGETASSGTCSIAAAVASAFAGKTEREISVHAPGGTTETVWRAGDDEMLITGRADLVFCGEYFI